MAGIITETMSESLTINPKSNDKGGGDDDGNESNK